jgi:hypothetical protein
MGHVIGGGLKVKPSSESCSQTRAKYPSEDRRVGGTGVKLQGSGTVTSIGS